jgi:hypothetical protein
VLFDGMPRPQAAATVGATDAQVAQAVAAERAAERAQGLGLSAAFAQQTIYNRALLGAIEDDGVFAEAAITVMAANMGGASTQRLCARIQAAATTADAYDRIEAVAASRNGHTGGRGVKRNDLTMLTDAVYALLDVDPAAAAGLVQIGDEQAWSDRIKRAALHLMAIDRAVTAPKTEAA